MTTVVVVADVAGLYLIFIWWHDRYDQGASQSHDEGSRDLVQYACSNEHGREETVPYAGRMKRDWDQRWGKYSKDQVLKRCK